LQSVAKFPGTAIFEIVNGFKRKQALMTKRKLQQAAPEELVGMVNELKQKLKKKNQDLTRTRERLSKAKSRIQKLKGIVTYQRDRIIELHT
jgi:hypothetical protein